ncbi:Uncharacterized membrane protein [Georgenia satyanarayanai]|uniref:Uncharacterized membrane protein n=1 Tax=Georgenia satyanarayanai TaxID=860221 RepID=A0A2Y9APV3_9MICO|nr:DUF1345 domain-containing protein [Georgenia satyanarayanai]PYF96824.1 putative membrane protein [Georgenia satyanarayanai]SSA46420.1 Uncharacterized membrane protein [Georgenia satyanarayanai]
MAHRTLDLPRRTRWLADDLTRSWLLLPVLVAVWLLLHLAPELLPGDDGPTALARGLVVYATLLLGYPVLTVVAFAGLSGERLALALGEARRRQLRRPRWLRWSLAWRDDGVGGDGPSWPVLLALGSLAVAVWLIVSESVHETGAVVVTSIVMSALAWGGSLVAYAVHVARLDTVAGGLRFPGDDGAEERHFSDYLYLSLGVQAAFGPADVQTTTPRMRRTLAGHMLVGWTFNTVVLAALISFLVGLN